MGGVFVVFECLMRVEEASEFDRNRESTFKLIN